MNEDKGIWATKDAEFKPVYCTWFDKLKNACKETKELIQLPTLLDS